MKIFYVTNARLPTEKAHGLATVKLCEAFARLGVDVTIFAPRRINPIRQDAFAYYGVAPNFSIRYLPSVDLLWLGFAARFFYFVQVFSFSIVAALWLGIRYGVGGRLRDVVIFSHDHVPLVFVSFIAPNLVYDIHRYPTRSYFYRRVMSRARVLAVQTRLKIGKLGEDFGIPAEQIVYWPNGTDVERFDIRVSGGEARQKLGLPFDRKIVLYSGSLQHWKGVETLIAAAIMLQPGAYFYIVGGTQGEIEALKTRNPEAEIRNVVFVGQKPWAEIPLWLKAADILILPNTARDEESLYYTSPMKLFEYMASGRPIVASDILSIREIVDESMVFFATPDDPLSFAHVIQKVFSEPHEAQECVRRARQKSCHYTWDARAKKILTQIHVGKK